MITTGQSTKLFHEWKNQAFTWVDADVKHYMQKAWFASKKAHVVKSGEAEVEKLQVAIKTWGDLQFGTDPNRVIGMAAHLVSEADELKEVLKEFKNQPNLTAEEQVKLFHKVVEEIADCFMLIIDIINHLPLSFPDLLQATWKKLKINKKRTWGRSNSKGYSEHIK